MGDNKVEESLNDDDFMDKYGDIDQLEDESIDQKEEEEVSNEDEPEANEEEAEDTTQSTDTEDESTEKGEEENESKEEPTDEAIISKDDQLDSIYAPFKANGVDISVTNPQEVIRLMQQGAGASKRMQDLAPKLKMIQMLENNDLLNEDAINQLIAVGSKDKAAIANLLKSAEIDPYDLEMDQENYQAKDHRVSDNEFKLNQVINDLSSQPKFQETLDTADSWDEQSKQMAMDDPEILTTLNGHIQSGIYSQIDTIIKQEVIKGNISSNTPFLEAYRNVGTHLAEAGAFDQGNGDVSEQTSNMDNDLPNNSDNKQLNSRKQSASSTKSISSSSKTATTKSKDIFAMSDEAFLEEFANEEWMNPI